FCITIEEALPCAGTPDPGNTTGPASACTGVDFNLTFENAEAASGLTYQWQSSPDGVTWTNVGTDSPTLTISQTAATYYQVIVTCDGFGSGTSTPLLVGMALCYCESTATSTSFEKISNVEIG